MHTATILDEIVVLPVDNISSSPLQNVPTLGMSALSLASLLCDEVSLAGFGYNLSQQGAPLHYYDQLPMAAMLQQTMHNVERERELLRGLVEGGAISDLTGGLHCAFCPPGSPG